MIKLKGFTFTERYLSRLGLPRRDRKKAATEKRLPQFLVQVFDFTCNNTLLQTGNGKRKGEKADNSLQFV